MANLLGTALLLQLALPSPDSAWRITTGRSAMTDVPYLILATDAVAPITVAGRSLLPEFGVYCNAKTGDPFIQVDMRQVVDRHYKEKHLGATYVTERLDQQPAEGRGGWYIAKDLTTVSPDHAKDRLAEWAQGTTLLLSVPMYPGHVGLVTFSMVGLRELLPRLTEVCGVRW